MPSSSHLLSPPRSPGSRSSRRSAPARGGGAGGAISRGLVLPIPGIGLLALATLAACDGGMLITGDISPIADTGDGGAAIDLATDARPVGRDLAPGRDSGASPDLARSCATVICGAHARCDPSSLACVCEPGYGGDPKAGCTAQTACGMCPARAHCDNATRTCACDPGWVLSGGACAVAPVVDPAQRGATEVCEAWRQGRVVTDGQPWTQGQTECDPGVLSAAGVADVLRRVNLYRWLSGLYPATDDPANSARDQQCALMLARNGQLNHQPPTTWKCYTAEGAAGARTSNEAQGAGHADAIDLYVADPGTPSMGHRRWVLNPGLNGVGVGFVPSWQCLGVFGGGNKAPPSPWQAVPNPGPTPTSIASLGTWTFHAAGADLSKAVVEVVRKDDGAPLAVKTSVLPYGFGVDAIGITRSGWQVETGRTYTVTVSGTRLGTVIYDVKPVACP